MRLAALRALEFVLIVASLAISLVTAFHGHWQPAAVAGLVVRDPVRGLSQRIRRAHFSWDANILALFGLPLFSYLLLRSKSAHAKGSVPWKGRNYSDEQLFTGNWPLTTGNCSYGLSNAQS